MNVICEECGKIYHLDPEKLKKNITGKSSKIKCRICGFSIVVAKPGENIDQEIVENEQTFQSDLTDSQVSEKPTDDKPEKKQKSDKKSSVKIGVGVRSKMFFLFLVIPIALMATSGLLFHKQLDKLATNIIDESVQVVKEMGEDNITDTGRAIALQVKIYLLNHPDLNKEDFNYDLDLKRISVQKVGLTGYTVLFERPSEINDVEGFRIWTHPNSKLIGRPLFSVLKNELGASFNRFRNILEPTLGGKSSKGYYLWKDKDGKLREKFMVVEPVEGTPYFIVSTTYIDEFTGQMNQLENNTLLLKNETIKVNLTILAASLIIIGFTIIVYGYRLTNKIKILTDTADRISVGELDVEINISSKDEIGRLAEAISRMQDSLRFSIERLRRKK